LDDDDDDDDEEKIAKTPHWNTERLARNEELTQPAPPPAPVVAKKRREELKYCARSHGAGMQGCIGAKSRT
jgi:hypothetical protein